jgi:hypothetical protein
MKHRHNALYFTVKAAAKENGVVGDAFACPHVHNWLGNNTCAPVALWLRGETSEGSYISSVGKLVKALTSLPWGN